MVSRLENMRLIVQSIMATVPKLTNVLLVLILFFFIFAILGVQFFKGRLQRCEVVQGASAVLRADLNIKACLAIPGGVWRNPPYHFDDSLTALLVLFEVGSLEMWPNIMHAAMDSTPPGMAPSKDYTSEAAIFFIVFILIGAFFVISLFVGVVVDQYNKMHDQFTGSNHLCHAQREFLQA